MISNFFGWSLDLLRQVIGNYAKYDVGIEEGRAVLPPKLDVSREDGWIWGNFGVPCVVFSFGIPK